MAHLAPLISQYGYLIVAAFIFFEGIAIPFPTDTTIVTAAAFAAHGRLSLWVIFLVSTAASSAGTTIAFLLGRRGGDFFEKHSKRVSPKVLARTQHFFERHGGSAVFAGRFIPFARMLISPMAGLSELSIARFTVFNVSGAALWSAVFCGVGYFFGQHPPAFGGGLARAGLVVVIALALLTTVLVAGGWLVEESDAAWRAEGTIWHSLLMSAPLRWLAGHSPRARAFLFRRFTPEDYLGLNLTIGLGMSFVALIVFSAVTNALLAHDALPLFDRQLALALRQIATPTSDAAWRMASELGHIPIAVLPSLVVAIVFWWRGDRLPAAGWAAAMLGAAVLDLAVKHFFVHTHAGAALATVGEQGSPSGQALAVFMGYGLLGYFLVLLMPNRRTNVALVAAVLALVVVICFSRVALGTRYFSDVVSGLAAGGVWLCACVTGLEVARRRRERERVLPRADSDDRR